jgi:hypothetical protein
MHVTSSSTTNKPYTCSWQVLPRVITSPVVLDATWGKKKPKDNLIPTHYKVRTKIYHTTVLGSGHWLATIEAEFSFHSQWYNKVNPVIV